MTVFGLFWKCLLNNFVNMHLFAMICHGYSLLIRDEKTWCIIILLEMSIIIVWKLANLANQFWPMDQYFGNKKGCPIFMISLIFFFSLNSQTDCYGIWPDWNDSGEVLSVQWLLTMRQEPHKMRFHCHCWNSNYWSSSFLIAPWRHLSFPSFDFQSKAYW